MSAWLEIHRQQYEMRQRFEAALEERCSPPPPHSGAVDCPKCGAGAVGTRYCKGWNTALFLRGGQDCSSHRYEHLHRDCGRCGFGWTEQTDAGYTMAALDASKGSP